MILSIIKALILAGILYLGGTHLLTARDIDRDDSCE